jgi:hypothetical protein
MNNQIERPGSEEATTVATATGSAVQVAPGRDLAE